MSWALLADVEGSSKFNLGGKSTTHAAFSALLSKIARKLHPSTHTTTTTTTTTRPHGAISRTIHRWHRQTTGIGAAPHDSQHF
jgi:hypothetical protein